MDAKSEPVVLVSQLLAEALYPGTNPVGQMLPGGAGRIIGVVANVRGRSPVEPPMPALYVPRSQERSPNFYLLMTARADTPQLAADLRRILRDVYPGQPSVTGDDTEPDLRSEHRGPARLRSPRRWVCRRDALLSGLGLCGHLSHVVAERSRELAIRCALGSSPGRQVAHLVRHVVTALMAGVVVALLLVYLSFPLLAPFLFEVPRLDAAVWVTSFLLVTAFTGVALLVPVHRLMRLETALTLRST